MESAFKKHKNVIFQCYGTAIYIRRICMNLYNKNNNCDLGAIQNFDDKHYNIVLELLASYRANGENDPDFFEVCHHIDYIENKPDLSDIDDNDE
jgi:hypothetical protein